MCLRISYQLAFVTKVIAADLAQNRCQAISDYQDPAIDQGPLVLTWFNFNPSMDK